MLYNNFKILLMMKYSLMMILIHLAFLPELDARQTQQGIAVTGRITDDAGDPVPGATILIKGTTTGVTSDINGKYSIRVPDESAVLQFSFIGYNTEEFAVGDRRVIDVLLIEAAKELEEVVVIGYGTVAKKDLTGAISSVSGDRLKDLPVTSASQAMVGRLAGVQVTQTEGSPDAEIKIRVRGGGSITQDNSPLFIVDGFPVDNIDHVAPTDIQSIDVLKDASATAIYGARGANGVVLVTTKSGSEGKAKISYNAYYGIKYMPKFLGVLDSYEYVLLQHETQMNAASLRPIFGDFQDYDIWKSVPGSDWQKELFGNTGTSANHNLSISGGTKVFRYSASVSRNDNDEIMIGSAYDMTNLNVRTTYFAKDWLKLELNTTYSQTNIMGEGTGLSGAANSEVNYRLLNIIQYRPIEGMSMFRGEVYWDPDQLDIEPDDPTVINNAFSFNPVTQQKNEWRRLQRELLNFNGALELTLHPNLKYRFEYGKQTQSIENRRFWGRYHTNTYNDGRQPKAEINTQTIDIWRMANVLTFTKKNFLPDHNLTVMAGEEINNRDNTTVIISARFFPIRSEADDVFSMMQLGSADPIRTTLAAPERLSSWFGRLNYDYKGKYLFSGVFRADGSSKFAPGNQWGYFPSAAVAWRLSDESFMKSTEKWLSNLKLRASYGQSGNNRIPGDAWKKTFSVTTGTNELFIGDKSSPDPYIIQETTLNNPKLKWETTITRNAALEFGLFKQRFTGTIDVYQNTTRDLLINAFIPSSSGYERQWQNVGQTTNRGIELTIEGTIIQNRDFFLAASFNIGFNRNRVDKLGDVDKIYQNSTWNGGVTGDDYMVQVGKPVGMMYGHQSDGMYTFDDFDYDDATNAYVLKEGVPNNSAIANNQLFRPGTIKFADLPGNEEMTAVTNTPFGPRQWPLIGNHCKRVIGYAYPKHTGGFNFNGQYKGFDFSVFFNWSYGNDVYNANKMAFTADLANRPYRNMLDFVSSDKRFNNFHPETGVLVTMPDELMELNKNATIWTPAYRGNGMGAYSWVIEDGSFLRLNNATIGYSLPKKLLSRVKIQQLRLYVTGYNLWIWTKYTGYDPEVDTRRATPLTPGVDWCAYPRSRTYNVGLNLTF